MNNNKVCFKGEFMEIIDFSYYEKKIKKVRKDILTLSYKKVIGMFILCIILSLVLALIEKKIIY